MYVCVFLNRIPHDDARNPPKPQLLKNKLVGQEAKKRKKKKKKHHGDTSSTESSSEEEEGPEAGEEGGWAAQVGVWIGVGGWEWCGAPTPQQHQSKANDVGGRPRQPPTTNDSHIHFPSQAGLGQGGKPLTEFEKIQQGRKKLPVFRYREEILSAVRDHQVRVRACPCWV